MVSSTAVATANGDTEARLAARGLGRVAAGEVALCTRCGTGSIDQVRECVRY